MRQDKKDYTGEIISIENIALLTYKMIIKSALNQAYAGQFISIYCPNKTLRRPFSISDFDKNKKELTILFKMKGDGTKYLKNLNKGDKIKFLAPLGNFFNIENKNCLLVGAGIGIAPMLFLKKELNKQNINNFLITGFKKENEIINGSDKTIIGGSVLDNIENIIEEKNIETIYSCGPIVVLKKLTKLANEMNIKCYVAMERMMACSIGVCRGCVIQLREENEIVYKAVCKDGPIFEGNKIVWE